MSQSTQHSEVCTSIVDGKKVFPKNQTSFAVHEPPTGLEIAQVVNADAEVVAAAVA